MVHHDSATNVRPFDPRFTPRELLGIESLRVVSGDAGAVVGGIKRSPPRLALSTQAELHRRASYVVDMIADVFAFADTGPWKWQRPFYLELIRTYFEPACNGPAWVSIWPWRSPFDSRFSEHQTLSAGVRTGERASNARPCCPFHRLKRGELDLKYGIRIRGDALLLHYDRQWRDDVPYLITQERQRYFDTGRDFECESFDRLYYLGVFGADDERMKRAHVPAQKPYYDASNKQLTSYSFTLARMPTSPFGEVTQLVVTLRPEDGYTISLVPGFRSFRTQMRHYIDEHLLISKALGR